MTKSQRRPPTTTTWRLIHGGKAHFGVETGENGIGGVSESPGHDVCVESTTVPSEGEGRRGGWPASSAPQMKSNGHQLRPFKIINPIYLNHER